MYLTLKTNLCLTFLGSVILVVTLKIEIEKADLANFRLIRNAKPWSNSQTVQLKHICLIGQHIQDSTIPLGP